MESWIEVSLNMNFNLYSTSCIGISLPVRIPEGDIIKILMNLYNALEACIVGCYLEGLQKQDQTALVFTDYVFWGLIKLSFH